MSDITSNVVGTGQATTDIIGAMVEMKNAMSVIQSLGKLASAAGAVGAIFGVAAAIVQLALGDDESDEMKYMKEQFQVVRDKLDVVSDQIREVLRAIEQNTVNNQYFPIEENLKNQFRKYMDILNTKPEFRQNEKQEFLTHFDVTKG